MERDVFLENEEYYNTFKLVASTHDYVSIIENSTYGWFGVQFHPEKAQFEYGRAGERIYDVT